MNSFSFILRFNTEIKLTPEFSKYLFRSHFMRKAIAKTASGVTRYKVSKQRFKKLSIPLPPLPVQEEIVRILDNFTNLTAEFTTRKKQYEYYREQLYSLDKKKSSHLSMGMKVLVNLFVVVGYRKKTLLKQVLVVFTMVKFIHITEHIQIGL